MGASLVRPQAEFYESREQSLSRQFYEWETRGRGWRLRPYPVELEPPFRPVFIFDPSSDTDVDDGYVPTFWSSFFGGPSVTKNTRRESLDLEYRQKIAELDEPTPCDYYEDDFRELQIVLPRDLKVTRSVSEQLLSSLCYCANPIAFEIVGTGSEVIVQMSATERDIAHLGEQLTAYLPGAFLRLATEPFLPTAWETGGGPPIIVDFGLSNEFLIPLNVVPSFEIDPLVSIIGAMAELGESEVAIFQVLFQKTRSDWASEILDSVRFQDGTAFFANAPEMIPNAKQKVNAPLFAAVIRVAAKSPETERAWQIVRSVASGMSHLSTPAGNELVPLSNDGYNRGYHEAAMLNRLSFRCGMILNLAELVSLVHPPSIGVRSAKLVRENKKTKVAPVLSVGHTLVLGENLHQGKTQTVTLSNEYRTRHVHLVGSSGSGKSTLLLNLIKQDLENGQGVCVIDPHGDLIDSVIENVPENRVSEVILFDPSDSQYPIGFNILQARSPLEKTVLSSDLIAAFRRMSTSWGDVMDSVLANAILALLESPRGGTLLELKRFLVEKDFRDEYLASVTDDGVVYFWENEFPLIAGKPQASILIRLDSFLRQSLIRNIVCQKRNKLDFRGIMDGRKVLLIKLSQGLIGEENAHFLGTMLISKIYQSALSRQDTQNRPVFWLYLDEFHHFITPSMERILSGTRKYNLGLTLAHQEFRQMQVRSPEVASSVVSNCNTRICFRLGDADAEKLAAGFSYFDSRDLQNLGVGEAIARVERADFDFNLSVKQVPAVTKETASLRRHSITQLARTCFAAQKAHVEAEMSRVWEKTPRREAQAKPGSAEPRPRSSPQSKKAQIESEKMAAPEISEHRYLQSIIKRIGEDKGFVATLEKEVFGGVGKIDVALENEGSKIACEIAITNATQYEVQNIQKCLSSGFDRVAVISTDTRHLRNIKKRAEMVLSPIHFSKVHFLEPEHFHLLLDSIAAKSQMPKPKPEKVKGYLIKTGVKQNSVTEESSKKSVVLDILSRAIGRKKGI